MNMKERTDGLFVQKSFSICGCPVKLIQEFKEFGMSETKNDYSMGLKILLERNSINFQQEVFASKIREIEDRMILLEQPKEQEGTRSKTFGGNKNESSNETIGKAKKD